MSNPATMRDSGWDRFLDALGAGLASGSVGGLLGSLVGAVQSPREQALAEQAERDRRAMIDQQLTRGQLENQGREQNLFERMVKPSDTAAPTAADQLNAAYTRQNQLLEMFGGDQPRVLGQLRRENQQPVYQQEPRIVPPPVRVADLLTERPGGQVIPGELARPRPAAVQPKVEQVGDALYQYDPTDPRGTVQRVTGPTANRSKYGGYTLEQLAKLARLRTGSKGVTPDGGFFERGGVPDDLAAAIVAAGGDASIFDLGASMTGDPGAGQSQPMTPQPLGELSAEEASAARQMRAMGKSREEIEAVIRQNRATSHADSR